MKKTIRERESEWKEKPDRTVGVDLGDRFSHYCVLNGDGEVMEEGRMRTSEEAFRRHWEAEPRQRIVMETGTHSPWISRLLRGFGHQVIVANARSGLCSALIADEGAGFAIYAAERRHRAAHDGWTRNPLAPDYRTSGGTEIPTASARPQSAGTFEISLKM